MVLRNIRYIYCLILFCYSTILFSQEKEFIQGKLQDAQTGEPVVFATIRIKDNAIGVISNQDGGFRIPKKFKELGDVLVVSSMGYQKKEIPIESLSHNDVNIIRLSYGVLELAEAVVTAKKKRQLSPRRIVRRALEAIPVNFSQNSFSTVGYYRDYQLNEENEYINLNEAIIEVFDAGFDELDHKTSRIRIYDYKKNTDFRRNHFAEQKYDYRTRRKIISNAFLSGYGGNEFIILRIHDAIRSYKVNSFDFVNTLEKDLLSNHSFFREEDLYLDDEILYTIGITKSVPASRVSNKLYITGYKVVGRLYISKNDFAIHGMEYTLYDNQNFNINKKSNPSNPHGQPIFEVVTEYKRIYTKMYLNYISLHNLFRLKEEPKFIAEDITVDFSKKYFIVTFNTEPEARSANILRNYKFKFKGRKLKFLRSELNKKRIVLYPDIEKAELDAMFKEIEENRKDGILNKDLLVAEIENIKDKEGNLLNEWTFKDYQQFREYFVQRINQKAKPIPDSLLMKRNRPIFEDQPIVKPDDFEEYWMNTPLK
ncbi:carboxypeptidase-like regulatory domain-containing protein [Ulvibacterium marinum]|uniref:Carboxypeptidase-like regulatory domain-containing protein n=1 Tax=Ulvibacterium marinum TaxID=2419782 RepID=A0A3B0C5L9_9FLAO|nr:carboxypeptidase-like regulatory domain-containing protein [Ulvibacterium marinum]